MSDIHIPHACKVFIDSSKRDAPRRTLCVVTYLPEHCLTDAERAAHDEMMKAIFRAVAEHDLQHHQITWDSKNAERT